MSTGTGKVQLDVGQLAVFNAGQGWFLGPGLICGNLSNATAAALVLNANEVNAVQFVLHESWTIRHVTYGAAVAGAAGSTISIGIYSADRSKKLLQATFDGTVTSPQAISVNVTLPPGVYWYAWSASTPTTLTGFVIPNMGVSTGQVWQAPAGAPGYLNKVVVKYGLASNATVAGVLPTSLGTMTQDANHPTQNVPCAIFEP